MDKFHAFFMGKVKYYESDLIGAKFGKLSVTSVGGKRWGQFVLCLKCDCGMEFTSLSSRIVTGKQDKCPKCSVVLMKQTVNRKSDLARIFRMKVRARNGIEVRITEDEFLKVSSGDCYYCGAKPKLVDYGIKQPKYAPARKDFYLNGIDRIDPLGHYEMKNIVPCCSRCNMAKRSLSRDEFIRMAREVCKFQENA